MQRIRLSQNVVLEITDNIVSRAINAAPFLHLYEFGTSYLNNKLLVQSDGQTEQRSSSYWPIASNVILSSTPTFYLDDVISAGFHATSNLTTIFPVATSMLQYKKVRMLFAQGFNYSAEANKTALTTLNIYAIRPGNNARIDLLSFYDSYDDSKILAIPQVLFDNQLFNQAIELEVLDLAYLYNSSQPDIVAVRQRLFGNDEIETLFIDHAGVQLADIVSIIQSGNTYKRFSDANKNTSQWSSRFSNDEIICNASLIDDAIVAQVVHEKFDLESYLAKTSDIVGVTYTFKFDDYNSSDAFIGSEVIAISTPLDKFGKVKYRHTPLDAAAYVNVEVTAIIYDTDNNQIERSALVVIPDASILKSVVLDFEITEQKLVTTVNKTVQQIVYKQDTPKVVFIERPQYVHTSSSESEIILTPYAQTIELLLPDVNLSAVQNCKLNIGAVQFINEPNNKLTFKLSADVYYTKETKWYLLDDDDAVISYGKITTS